MHQGEDVQPFGATGYPDPLRPDGCRETISNGSGFGLSGLSVEPDEPRRRRTHMLIPAVGSIALGYAPTIGTPPARPSQQQRTSRGNTLFRKMTAFHATKA